MAFFDADSGGSVGLPPGLAGGPTPTHCAAIAHLAIAPPPGLLNRNAGGAKHDLHGNTSRPPVQPAWSGPSPAQVAFCAAIARTSIAPPGLADSYVDPTRAAPAVAKKNAQASTSRRPAKPKWGVPGRPSPAQFAFCAAIARTSIAPPPGLLAGFGATEKDFCVAPPPGLPKGVATAKAEDVHVGAAPLPVGIRKQLQDSSPTMEATPVAPSPAVTRCALLLAGLLASQGRDSPPGHPESSGPGVGLPPGLDSGPELEMPPAWCSRFAPEARPAALRAQNSEQTLSTVPELAVAPEEPIRLPKPKRIAKRHPRDVCGPRLAMPAESTKAVEVQELAKPARSSQRSADLGGRNSCAPGFSAPAASPESSPIEDAAEDCLFVVRRMNQLGFGASQKLSKHFSELGTVVRVQAAHSARRRPSSFGFVQMAAAEDVAKVLELGEDQLVNGIAILVQKFERQRPDRAAESCQRTCRSDSVGSLVSAETAATAWSDLDSDCDSTIDISQPH